VEATPSRFGGEFRILRIVQRELPRQMMFADGNFGKIKGSNSMTTLRQVQLAVKFLF